MAIAVMQITHVEASTAPRSGSNDGLTMSKAVPVTAKSATTNGTSARMVVSRTARSFMAPLYRCIKPGRGHQPDASQWRTGLVTCVDRPERRGYNVNSMISLVSIRKRFGAVTALDGVSLNIGAGEIHGLLGENGAGKTTLMNILFGLLQPDAGEIRIDAKPAILHRPEDAQRAGIAMVHQHFMLIEHMSVAQNVMLGDRSAPLWMPRRRMREVVNDAARRLGLDVNPDALIEPLSVGQRQRVELLKVLRRPVRCLILDEPTAVLSPGEVDALFKTLRRLRGEGCAVVFISHKLSEVM